MKPKVVIDIHTPPGVDVTVNVNAVDAPVEPPVPGPGLPLKKLQQIVDDAGAGSVVWLDSALYIVQPNEPLIIRKAIRLRARQAQGVVLKRYEKENEDSHYLSKCLVNAMADDVILDGLVLSGPDTASISYAGLISSGTGNNFRNGLIEGIWHTGLGYGVLVDRESVDFTLADSTLQRCRHGIDTARNENQSVVGTKILRNRFLDMEDDLIGNHRGAKGTVITGNYLEDGPLSVGRSAGMTLQGTEGLIIHNNRIKNNGGMNIGIFVQFIPSGREKGIIDVRISGNKMIGFPFADGIQLDGRAVEELSNLPVDVTFEPGNTVENFRHASVFYKRNSSAEQYVDKKKLVTPGKLTAPPTEFKAD